MSDALAALGRWASDQSLNYQAVSGRVQINTLDNPGWSLKVALGGTAMASRTLQPIEINRTEADWCHCFTRDGQFMAFGGARNLGEAIGRFIAWANQLPAPSNDPSLDIVRLQDWYAGNCDGEWEHASGVRIQTTPGSTWSIVINLQDTKLENAADPRAPARTENRHYLVTCGAEKLGLAIRDFLDWSDRSSGSAT